MVGWCCLCRCCGETVDHLLLHCPMSCQIWSFVFKLVGVDWVMSGFVLDQLACWRNWFGKHSLEVWNLVPYIYIYIERERERERERELSPSAKSNCHLWGGFGKAKLPLWGGF